MTANAGFRFQTLTLRHVINVFVCVCTGKYVKVHAEGTDTWNGFDTRLVQSKMSIKGLCSYFKKKVTCTCVKIN